jgi:hypothetical protein
MTIIRSSTTAVAASGLPLERGGSSAVGRGRVGQPCRQLHCIVEMHDYTRIESTSSNLYEYS